MTDRYDAIVIGAGHNGLVCATLLARQGYSVLVTEADSQVGGASISREFSEGYAVSACAHLLWQMDPALKKELGFEPRMAADDIETVALARDGAHVRIRGAEVSGVSQEDAENYRDFYKRMCRYARVLRRWLNKPPPRLAGGDVNAALTLAGMGLAVRRLGKNGMRDFLRLLGMNIHDELNECFFNPLLKGALSVDATLGTHMGPRSPGTVMTSLYRLAANDGRLSLPASGMGRVTAELAQIARAAGVTVLTGAAVQDIVVENGRVNGVRIANGELHESYTVVSSADPKHTLFELLGARHMETGFVRRIKHLRTNGNAAKLHLALNGLPEIQGLGEQDFGARLLIAPDEHYVERAFNPAKYGEYSPEPVIEMTFPSVHDETLAPAGRHVMSAVVQYAPYGLAGGWDESARESFRQCVIQTIARYATDIEQRIVASELLTPLDIEREFRITGGHWHHAELALDQFMFVRPFAGAAQYRMPVDGLYLCGAGTHPGGGVSGAAGRNAAKTLLKEWQSR